MRASAADRPHPTLAGTSQTTATLEMALGATKRSLSLAYNAVYGPFWSSPARLPTRCAAIYNSDGEKFGVLGFILHSLFHGLSHFSALYFHRKSPLLFSHFYGFTSSSHDWRMKWIIERMFPILKCFFSNEILCVYVHQYPKSTLFASRPCSVL